ncbi:MAG: alpha/beta hydrolase [Planctomycetota bacterium]|jgi:acetyl esterase/lipase
MVLNRIYLNNNMNMAQVLFMGFIATVFLYTSLQAVDLPQELPLWDKPPQNYVIRTEIKEQVRIYKARPGAPSGSNRVFSSVSLPTYSIHHPLNPNGVGLVICPGGGFRDVWLDREGHDLAIWLKDHGVTCLVLKYRTRLPDNKSQENAWQNYKRIIQADGRQAIRILRQKASALGLQSDKIGICGFSAGGHLAISCSLHAEPILPEAEVSGIPDFAGLFYPGIPDDIGQLIESRTGSGNEKPGICPMFIINTRVDRLTPVDKCIDFYSMLLKAGVNAELHVFDKGSHGFDLGIGRGKSVAIWPESFIAWLSDSNIIQY